MIAAIGLEYVGFSMLYIMTLVSTMLTLLIIWTCTKRIKNETSNNEGSVNQASAVL